MFYEKEMLAFHLLDVWELKQDKYSAFNKGRNFSALSFRFDTDASLQYGDCRIFVQNQSVCYVPARLDYTRIATRDNLIVIHFDTTNYHARDIEYFQPRNPQALAELFREILDCWNQKAVGYQYECASILCKIFAECYRQNYKTPTKGSKIEKSVDYIQKHFRDSNLKIKDAAEQSFISEVYFRRLFKETFGTSPRKYIVTLRIQNAVGLISAGYFSLSEVAVMSGYNDYKYFSVEFKRVMGVSPSEYMYNFKDRK